jgi:putative pyruvate formate lyase activating enzyme
MHLEKENLQPKFTKLLATGELKKRVEQLENLLESCTVCPKDCGNNRLKDEIAACYSGRLPIVSSYTAHFGEEPVLSGTRGAGNIFFGNCNLRCVYCQNHQISQTWKTQKKNETTHERLAEMMLELQAKGCHNIGFVSPTHFAPQMARAILIAAENGLKLPIVYNTNAYDSVEVLKLLDGIVDVYLPDLKCDPAAVQFFDGSRRRTGGGQPPAGCRKIARHSEALGRGRRFTFQMDNAGLSHQQLLQSIELIGEKVFHL